MSEKATLLTPVSTEKPSNGEWSGYPPEEVKTDYKRAQTEKKEGSEKEFLFNSERDISPVAQIPIVNLIHAPATPGDNLKSTERHSKIPLYPRQNSSSKGKPSKCSKSKSGEYTQKESKFYNLAEEREKEESSRNNREEVHRLNVNHQKLQLTGSSSAKKLTPHSTISPNVSDINDEQNGSFIDLSSERESISQSETILDNNPKRQLKLSNLGPAEYIRNSDNEETKLNLDDIKIQIPISEIITKRNTITTTGPNIQQFSRLPEDEDHLQTCPPNKYFNNSKSLTGRSGNSLNSEHTPAAPRTIEKERVMNPRLGVSGSLLRTPTADSGSSRHSNPKNDRKLSKAGLIGSNRSLGSLDDDIKHRRFTKGFLEQIKNEAQIGITTIVPRHQIIALNVEQIRATNSEEEEEEERFKALGIGNPTDNPRDRMRTLKYEKLQSGHQHFNNLQDPILVDSLLMRVQLNNRARKALERAIILFNQKAMKGLEYLWKSQMMGKEPETVAEFLLTTPGLSKEEVGQFFGKPNEFNMQVLTAFSNKVDFEGLPTDEAMRLYLSLFRLPKESQQIDRILEAFSKSYFEQNTGLFTIGEEGLETSYVLAYTVLFLNTMNHNPNVAARHRITEEGFIRLNDKALQGSLTNEDLAAIFDRINTNEFKTDTNYLEKIYDRINAFLLDENLNINKKQMLKMATTVVLDGDNFLKFGRSGKPHSRYVFLTQDESQLCWMDKSRKGNSRSIPVSQIYDVEIGSTRTKVFKRHNIPPEFDERCFSIISYNRTLDLQARSKEDRNNWVKYFQLKVKENKALQINEEQLRLLEQNKLQKREELELIWDNEIMTDFHNHWDMENHCPALRPYRVSGSMRTQSKSKKSTNFLCCGGKKKQRHTSVVARAPDYRKTSILDWAWRQGMPCKFRRKLWPFSIRNQLEITKSLHEYLVQKAATNIQIDMELENILSKNTKGDNLLTRMETDLLKTCDYFGKIVGQDCTIKKETLIEIMKAFVLYRPDIGYFKDMGYIACMLLSYCNEYDSFVCFANLIHTHHFLPFFQGKGNEIQLRIDYFNNIFQKQMPDLYQYFQALDITTDIFLIEWMLTLYTKHTDIEISSRIWDCFLLDGEVFALRVGLAILKYFERSFQKQTRFYIVEKLNNMHNKLEETKLFEYIEHFQIDGRAYKEEIQQQSFANKKSALFMMMFDESK